MIDPSCSFCLSNKKKARDSEEKFNEAITNTNYFKTLYEAEKKRNDDLQQEMYKSQPFYYDQWKVEKQRADDSELRMLREVEKLVYLERSVKDLKDVISGLETNLMDATAKGNSTANLKYALEKLRELVGSVK